MTWRAGPKPKVKITVNLRTSACASRAAPSSCQDSGAVGWPVQALLAWQRRCHANVIVLADPAITRLVSEGEVHAL